MRVLSHLLGSETCACSIKICFVSLIPLYYTICTKYVPQRSVKGIAYLDIGWIEQKGDGVILSVFTLKNHLRHLKLHAYVGQ